VIVHDFYVVSVSALPSKTDTKLVVDANAVLSSSVTLQFLKSISGGSLEVGKILSSIKQEELDERHPKQIGGRHSLAFSGLPKLLNMTICKAQDHCRGIITLSIINGSRY